MNKLLILLRELRMKKAILILFGTAALQGCISFGTYQCKGVNVRAPIVPIGVQIGPCDW